MSTYLELSEVSKSLGMEGTAITDFITTQQNLQREERTNKKEAAYPEKK